MQVRCWVPTRAAVLRVLVPNFLLGPRLLGDLLPTIQNTYWSINHSLKIRQQLCSRRREKREEKSKFVKLGLPVVIVVGHGVLQTGSTAFLNALIFKPVVQVLVSNSLLGVLLLIHSSQAINLSVSVILSLVCAKTGCPYFLISIQGFNLNLKLMIKTFKLPYHSTLKALSFHRQTKRAYLLVLI